MAEEFARSARLFAEAAALLAAFVDTDADYLHLVEETDKAQRRAEEAYIAFEEHIDRHRCTTIFGIEERLSSPATRYYRNAG